MSKSDQELDVIDAIAFLQWQTVEEIIVTSGQKRSVVKKVIKEQVDEGYLEVDDKTYRYFNSTY